MNSKLNIYFYHTRLTRESYEEWKDFRFPGHILYGLPLLENYGIQSVMHRYKVNPEKPDVPLNKNDAFQKVQKRRVQEKR